MMKRFTKSMSGVTLLEIMLVLAIAAMIIVMSVRYYQSANASQQATAALGQLQAITAAADGLAQGSGSYVTGNVSSATVGPLLPGGPQGGLMTPWGTTIDISASAPDKYTVAIPTVPYSVCPLLYAKLAANPHIGTSVTACGGAGATNMNYTYTANP